MKKSKIELGEKDTALVFRDDGKLVLYLRSNRNGKNIKPSDNEILTYTLSELIRIPGWVEDQVKLYDNLNKEQR